MRIGCRVRIAGFASGCLLFAVLLLLSSPARALIEFTRGNSPVGDGEWPAGTLGVANLSTRVGVWQGDWFYWRGSDFRGGSLNFLYRGDTAAFQEALDHFAKILAPERKLVIKEGAEESEWLKSSPTDAAGNHVDWTFVVWSPKEWFNPHEDSKLVFFNSSPGTVMNDPVPSPCLTVNVAGLDGRGIDWSRVRVPAGVTLVDERATSAGYARDDGSVLRGDLYDLLTSKPIAGARITLDAQGVAKSDGAGHFEFKHVPAGAPCRDFGGRIHRAGDWL